VAASAALLVLLVPATELAPNWRIGHDVLAVAGVLALGRFAVAAASWDVANGFSLMGASRDLTISVFVEITLVLSLAVAALVAGSTDLRAMVAATAGTDVWSNPALALGAVAFALVVIAETGRQPVDNPDTHLELTMIHEGPLLEYAGRDLAYLLWAAAARHWLVLVLGVQIFLPHVPGVWWQLGLLPIGLIALCAALALVETLVAKLRILLVPRLLAVGALVALLGVVARLVGTT
jgi:formate hydrogenlyase subunit 4